MPLLLITNDDNLFVTTYTSLVTFNDKKFKTSTVDVNFEDLNYMLFKFFPTSEKLLTAKQCKIPTELSGITQLLKTLHAK